MEIFFIQENCHTSCYRSTCCHTIESHTRKLPYESSAHRSTLQIIDEKLMQIDIIPGMQIYLIQIAKF